MKIKFDSNQDYQLEAIRSVVDIFDGQPFARGAFEVDLGMESGKLLSELGFGNRLLIDEQTILQNVRTVQERNGLPVTDVLEGMHFTTEMETGTGKTYVYLRTIYELNKLYGLRKFIIVVPSVAIREGVLKSIELTRVHFRAIYGGSLSSCPAGSRSTRPSAPTTRTGPSSRTVTKRSSSSPRPKAPPTSGSYERSSGTRCGAGGRILKRWRCRTSRWGISAKSQEPGRVQRLST